MNPIVAWIAEQLFWMVADRLAKHWGLDKTKEHFEGILKNATPLPPDPLPSPKAQQGPIEGHYGG